ncbi:MAG: hypothetical protein NC548_11210 [Lachnospiraceae bacterium]|nr:hypothetical protein [Lachnospiraceae bacterium]
MDNALRYIFDTLCCMRDIPTSYGTLHYAGGSYVNVLHNDVSIARLDYLDSMEENGPRVRNILREAATIIRSMYTCQEDIDDATLTLLSSIVDTEVAISNVSVHVANVPITGDTCIDATVCGVRYVYIIDIVNGVTLKKTSAPPLLTLLHQVLAGEQGSLFDTDIAVIESWLLTIPNTQLASKLSTMLHIIGGEKLLCAFISLVRNQTGGNSIDSDSTCQ